MYPIVKFDKVKDHPKKYLFCRLLGDDQITSPLMAPYAGLEMLGEYGDLFEKIYMYPCPETLNEQKFENYTKHIQNFNIECIDDKVSNLKIDSRYPRYKNMSTGFIVYDYIKKNKLKNDSIVIIGFTSDINRNYHHPNWEGKFFRNELYNKECVEIW
jgi:hypothetical protein